MGSITEKDSMSAGDYVSERLTSKSIARIIKDLVPPYEHKKYVKVLVPLVNEAFGPGFDTLRLPKDPQNPLETFNKIFENALERKTEAEREGLPRKEICAAAEKMFIRVFPDIPEDYFIPPGDRKANPWEKKVCIIGAGAAGLYAAMILDHFDIKYDFLEASRRIGGRIFTKKLEDGQKGGHDYFDVGAMRYPDIPMMDRTFKLFDKLGMTRENKVLIPYHLHGENNPRFFNNRYSPTIPKEKDFFAMGERSGGVVPDRDIEVGFQALLENAYRPFKEEFKKNKNRAGWKKLSEFDMYSTRAYLALEEKLSPETIEWCENMSVTAGLFDQAFSESVIRSLEFDQPDIKWWCIEGGSEVFINRMHNRIKTKPSTGKRVKSIEVVQTADPAKFDPKYPDSINVQVVGEAKPRNYSHVLSSIPLSCLRCVDLSKAALSYDQHIAIRSLGYDSSVKVGIKFKTAWWRNPAGPNIRSGGHALTDGLIGLCVYPSYGFDDPIDEPAVMIVSYTLAQDARRMGALSQGKETSVEKRLIELCLTDLAKLHNMTYEELSEQYLDHYAHDWYRDENAMGAFALFSPGQFGSTYPSMLRPAGKGRLNFIGEAISRQHGWVSGSLNSAWRGVDNMFNREGDKEKRKALRKDWGGVNDLSEATLNLSVLMGTRGKCLTPVS